MKSLFPHRFSRGSSVTVAVLVLLVFLTILRFQSGSNRIDQAFASPPGRLADDGPTATSSVKSQHPPRPRPTVAPGGCTPELDYLRRPELNLTARIIYSRRCLEPISSNQVDRDDIANISRSLFVHKAPLDLNSCAHVDVHPCDRLIVRVPPLYPEKTYSDLLFGVATSYERLVDSMPSFAHWLAGSEATLLGIVSDSHQNPDRNLTALEELFGQSGMKAKFIKPQDKALGVSEIHFTMIRDLLHEAAPKTKWIGLLDDDTFFPSIYKLSVALAQFDHTKPAYLGALSEDFKAVQGFGYQAFGGAGVFLSVPLAMQLEPILEPCITEARVREGDAILSECIYRHTHAKLTQVPGLHQMDMQVDASGFYEAGLEILSVHHWKSWYQSPVVKMAAITGLCGDCFLQRWRFGNDTVLSNGYSVAVYRDGLEHLELDKMEGTWLNPDGGFDYSIGPLRERMGNDEKKNFRLLDAEKLPSGAFRQVYVYKGNEEEEEDDEVLELLWET